MDNVTVFVKLEKFSDVFDKLRAFRSLGLVADYWPRGGETAKEYIPITHNIALTGNPAWITQALEMEKNGEIYPQPDRTGAEGVCSLEQIWSI